jgi:hypothetical protein
MKLYFVLGLILVGLFLFGCTESSNGAIPLNNPDATMYPALETEKTDFCIEFETIAGKDVCYREQALLNKDESYCEKINDSRTKQTCIAMYAILTKNKYFCEKIQSPDVVDLCLIKFVLDSNDPNLCQTLYTDLYQEGCYKNYVKTTEDYNILNLIKKDSIKDEIYFSLAIDSRDKITCSSIKDPQTRENCYYSITQIDEFGMVYYKINDTNLFLKLPASWGTSPVLESETTKLYAVSNDVGNNSIYTDNFQVNVKKVLSTETLDSYYSRFIYTRNTAYDPVILSEKPYLVDGLKAKLLTSKVVILGIDTIITDLLFIKNDTLYILSLYSKKETNDETWPLFEKSFESIVFE